MDFMILANSDIAFIEEDFYGDEVSSEISKLQFTTYFHKDMLIDKFEDRNGNQIYKFSLEYNKYGVSPHDFDDDDDYKCSLISGFLCVRKNDVVEVHRSQIGEEKKLRPYAQVMI